MAALKVTYKGIVHPNPPSLSLSFRLASCPRFRHFRTGGCCHLGELAWPGWAERDYR